MTLQEKYTLGLGIFSKNTPLAKESGLKQKVTFGSSTPPVRFTYQVPSPPLIVKVDAELLRPSDLMYG